MTIDEILNIRDDNELIIALGQRISAKIIDIENLEELSEAEKTFVYVDMLEQEINNGGIGQFFFNYSGQYSHEALESLKKIKAVNTAVIMDRAISYFPIQPIPKDTEVRRKIMMTMDESVEDKWDDLDAEFYKYEDPILQLLVSYIKENRIGFK